MNLFLGVINITIINKQIKKKIKKKHTYNGFTTMIFSKLF